MSPRPPLRCLLYYGEAMPPPGVASQLHGAYVVLQPYHPLCAEGRFAEAFAGSRRFVYFNPVRLHPSELPGALDLYCVDDQLDSYGNLLVDLAKPDARRFMLGRADELQSRCGAHGLFLDDLDAYAFDPEREALMRIFLRDLQALRRDSIPVFANRGFPFWPELRQLEAVLLENVTPELVRRGTIADAAWLDEVLGAHLPGLGAQTALFGLQYDEDISPTPTGAEAPVKHVVADLLKTKLSNVLQLGRRLDAWVV